MISQTPLRHATTAIRLFNHVHALCRSDPRPAVQISARDFDRNARILRNVIATRSQLDGMRNEAAKALIRFRERGAQIALRSQRREPTARTIGACA